MKPNDVAVVDAQGHVLSTVGGSTSSSVLQGSQTADYEARVTSNVQAMLDQVLGSGNAVVRVTADLDFDQAAKTTETYSATEKLPPSSSTTTTEKYAGNGQTVGGVLGVDGSTIDPTTTGGSGTGNYEKSSSTVNNPINKVTEQLTTAPGTVRRQSVSVIVADSLKGVDLTALQDSITAAAGVDTTRGDVVSVTQMPFDTTAAETAKAAIAQADKEAEAAKTTELIKTGGIGVAILIAVILFIIIGLKRGKKDKREAIDLGDLELLEAAKAQAIEAAAVPRALPAVPTIAESRRDDVLAMAAEQPAEVAEVLRGWLTAGRA
jgi:flagellar M-ring protein FliF